MSQYFVIANLDKRQFYAPSSFGGGAQLCAIGSAGEILAMLTSNGNGRGGGDIARTAYKNQKTEFEPKEWERIESEWECDYDHNHRELKGNVARIIVPKLIGSWAGDRIVTPGDYSDVDRWCSREEQLRVGVEKLFQQYRYEKEQYEHKYPRQFEVGPFIKQERTTDVTLYDVVHSEYTDIGDDLAQQLADYGWGWMSDDELSSRCQGFLSKRLLHEYDFQYVTGKGRTRRTRWRMHWLSPEMLDSFLRQCHTRKELNRVKTWLRKQDLEEWQRNALKCYRGYKDGQEVIDFKKLEEVLRAHGFRKDPEYRNMWKVDPILPAPQMLDAALAVEAMAEKRPTPRPVFGADEGDMSRIAEEAGVPMRQRVIDLDGSGVGS